VAKKKTISGARLLGRLKAVIGHSTNNSPSSIRVGDELDRYFQVPQGVIAFLITLDTSPEFRPDGLALQPDDVREATKVSDLHDAVKGWYRNNGWTVT